MAALLSYVRAVAAVLLLLSAVAAHQLTTVAAEPTHRGWSLANEGNVAFMPRGGAIGFRKGKSTAAQASVNNDSLEIDREEQQTAEEDADEELSSDETDSKSSDETTATVSPFQKAYQEEVSEIKKSQEFLKKQQRRRELDETWLDKGITAVIELFENIFRWEVIDY